MVQMANTIGRVIGYHGCDRDVAEKILSGHDELKVSTNVYDWLGGGTYFWINSVTRAVRWAEQQRQRDAVRPPTGRLPIKQPYAIGAFISTGNCLNLMDLRSTSMMNGTYHRYISYLERSGVDLPANSDSRNGISYRRELDCMVFEYCHYERSRDQLKPYDTVLGVFEEGAEAYIGAGYKVSTHAQIAVRNPSKSVFGYFRVRGLL